MPEPFVLYTSNDCDDCEKTAEFLRYRGIPFEIVNVDEDPEEAEFLALSTDDTTPTLIMGPEDDRIIMTAPSQQELARALDKLGYRDPRPDEGEDGIPNVDYKKGEPPK